MVGFIEALRRGWRVLFLVAVPVFAGVAAYTERLPNKYTASAVVSFSPRPTATAQVGADVVTLVLPKYEVYAESDQTVDRVGSRLGVSRSRIQTGLSVSIALQTSNLQISMSDKTPTVTSRVANALASEVVTFSNKDPLLAGAVVSQAAVPTSPSGPARRLIEGAGAVAAVLIGIGMMLLYDRLHPVVRSSTDVVNAAELRLVGALPRSSSARRSPQEGLANGKVGSAVRNLRTQLDRVGRQDERRESRGRVLVVTSAVEGEGKTTIASLLALATARVGQRVLLVDGDLVRPSLDRVFRLAPKPGVAQVLRSGVFEARNFAREDVVPNLSVAPTTTDPDAGDLISRGMGHLLRWAADTYEFVIVDAAPVLGNDSGPTLATLADDVLVIVRRGTRVTRVEEAIGTLRSLDASLIGVFANGTPATDQHGYYSYRPGGRTTSR
jgi:polysaccharide biosynthesis transport protein